MEVVPVAHRDLYRDHLGRQMGLHVIEDPLEVGVLLVHQRNEEDPGQVQLVADFPDFLGAHLHPARAAEDHDGGIGRVQAADHLAEVVEISGSVDEVDLGVEPLGVAEAEIDGMLAVDFVGGVVGERGAVFDRAVAPAGAGNEGERVNQGCLAAGAVPDERHISYGAGAIDLHGLHLLRWVGFPRWRGGARLSNNEVFGRLGQAMVVTRPAMTELSNERHVPCHVRDCPDLASLAEG